MEQAIAAAALNRWLNSEGAHSFDGFTYPYNLVTRWEGPGRGTVALYVDNEIGAAGSPAEDLHKIAAEMLDSIHDTPPDIGTITARRKFTMDRKVLSAARNSHHRTLGRYRRDSLARDRRRGRSIGSSPTLAQG